MRLESTMQLLQQTEGENSIKDDTKSKDIITLSKKMEEKCDSNDTFYNRNLGSPIVSIKSGDDINHIDTSDFFSVI
ncbi:unnamed protein product [Rhizophagus irregularis]|nr:unnamed protein product [Rhizophagus irregularis]